MQELTSDKKEVKNKAKREEKCKGLIRITVVEFALITIAFVICSLVIGFVFYNSLLSIAFLIPLFYPFEKVVSSELVLRKRKYFRNQFMECLNAMANAMDSGYSIESSVVKAKASMEILYGKESIIYKELVRMEGRLRLGVTIEDLFDEFSRRSKLREAYDLAGALRITKRSGDNISKVFKTIAVQIANEMKVESEVEVLIASKKYEHLIMCMVPILMILYMRMTSPDLMNYLYMGISGRVVMTVCLLVYIVAMYIGIRLIRKTKSW